MLAADSTDIDMLVRQTAHDRVAVSAAGEETIWAEAGWWLVPVVAVFVLASFRRERSSMLQEAHS